MVAKIVNLKKKYGYCFKARGIFFWIKKKNRSWKKMIFQVEGGGGKYVVLIGVEIWPKTGIMKPRKIWGTASYSLIEIY